MRDTYRPDIDGLRAISVVPVVLYHANIPPFFGGFIGVDVFFVISGYLITTILHREMAAGGFSFLGFYDRRIRRIFPALYVVLAATVLLGAFIMIPSEFLSLSRSLIPAALFYINIYFNQNISYFGIHEDASPLLHLWSLAVEEQFYIFFPIVLLALVRFCPQRRLALAVAGLAAASFGYAVWQMGFDAQGAFYLLPGRAWELLAGAFLAVARLPRPRAWVAGVLGAMGLALVLVPMVAYDRGTAFPGIAAVPPCVGAALVIYSGAFTQAGAAQRLLGLPALVYVGRISYSLYLWHWPLLVLLEIHRNRPPTLLQGAGVALLSAVLAGLSLRYVETPFRRLSLAGGRRFMVLGGGALAMLATVVAGRAFIAAGGALWPMNALTVTAEATAAERGKSGLACAQAFKDLPQAKGGDICALDAAALARPAEVLVWGDSHAGALFPGLGEAVADMGLTARLYTVSGCPPLIGGKANAPMRVGESHVCQNFNDAVMAEIARARPKLVILVGRWAMWTTHRDNDIVLTTTELPGGEARSRANSRRVFAHMMARTVAAVRETGARVLVFGQGPEFHFAPANCTARAAYLGRDATSCYRSPGGPILGMLDPPNTVIDDLARASPGVFSVRLSDVLCRDGYCAGGDGAEIFYIDKDHLSKAGARRVASSPAVRSMLRQALDGGQASGGSAAR